VAAQIYALWDDAAWGIGDLGALRRLAEAVAAHGGGAVLTSPLHQAAPGFPQQDSPYYPSTRRAWSPILLAIDTPPPAHLRVEPEQWIDRNLVWARKREHLWNRFAALPGPWPDPSPIALWNARRERFGADSGRWPAEVDDRITLSAQFHDWMQTLVAEQLQAVAETWPWASPLAAPTPTSSLPSSPPASASVLHPTSSTTRARTGDCPPSFPGGCALRCTNPSSTPCVPPCVVCRVCASTT
jgi:4-alpha-glucanotransferase